MKVKFWGTRGSLPAAVDANSIRDKVFNALKSAQGVTLESDAAIRAFIDQQLPFSLSGSYGTNTPCVEILNPDGPYIICDAGSGLRELGVHYMKTHGAEHPSTFHIFMSHLHWDHLQGFPFFSPAYIPGNRIYIHTYHSATEDAFRQQMSQPFFPVPFDALGADIMFDLQPPCTPFTIDDFKITGTRQNHPGTSYGYRFEKNNKTVVYSSDSEHTEEAYEEDYPFLNFLKDADLLIFDAQYNLTDATFTKANWGHSSNIIGVELSARANVKCLALFHHEPTNGDATLDKFLEHTRTYSNVYHQEANTSPEDRFPQKILLSYDGLEVEI